MKWAGCGAVARIVFVAPAYAAVSYKVAAADLTDASKNALEDAKDPKAAVAQIEHTLASTSDVVSVSAARYNAAGDTALVTVIPSTGPSDSKTTDLVHAIRPGHRHRAEGPARAADLPARS